MQKSLHSFFEPDVLTATDYYPFGMEMPGRKYNPQGYRYGFNGKENDRSGEWGLGLVQDYGARIYSPGLGRWLSTDPLQAKYPDLSPYCYVANSPLRFIDPDGRIIIDAKTGKVVLFDDKGKILNPEGELSLELLSAFDQLGKSTAASALIQKISASSINVSIMLGNTEQVMGHTGIEMNMGGTTNFNFDKKEVRVGVVNRQDMPLNTLGAIADELDQVDQFFKAEIAFIDKGGVIAYDLPDELHNKKFVADVLNANGVKGDDLVNEAPEAHSPRIVKSFMEGGTDEAGMTLLKQSGYAKSGKGYPNLKDKKLHADDKLIEKQKGPVATVTDGKLDIRQKK